MFRNLFSDRDFLRKLTKLALPIALQSFMLAAVAAANSLLLGSLEPSYMSAVSEATQVQFIQNMILSSVVSGCTILGAQYWGSMPVPASMRWERFRGSLRTIKNTGGSKI